MARKACILIACNDTYVLGWYLCRYENARSWVQSISAWKIKHRKFLAETTTDDNGTIRPKHERLLKAENSLNILVRNGNFVVGVIFDSLFMQISLKLLIS